MRESFRGAVLSLYCLLISATLPGRCSSGGTGDEGKTNGSSDLDSDEPIKVNIEAPEIAGEYVEIKKTDTGNGIVRIPYFKEGGRASEDISAANDLFASIENVMIKSAKEGREGMKNMFGNLSQTKIALNDNVLSIQVRDGTADVQNESSAPEYYYETANVDVTTGRSLPYEKLLELSGFSKEDV